MGQERREDHVTGGRMKGRKEVRVNASKGKSITGMMTGRKEAGKKGTTEKAGGRKVCNSLYSLIQSFIQSFIQSASQAARQSACHLI